jgi:hypothetical protein
MISVFGVVFSTLNCMRDAYTQIEDGTPFPFAVHYTSDDHTLNLSNLGITGPLLDNILFDLLTFINLNKIEKLYLDGNKFEALNDIMFLRKMTDLLTGCATLMTISLKNNFKESGTVEKGLGTLSPAAIEQLTESISQFQELFKMSLSDANQQTTTYVSKQILLDDMPPLSIISEIKLPPTTFQKIRTFAVSFGKGLALLILSSGGTILTIYLSGHFSCPASN